MEVKNAKISSTMLGFEGHGIFSSLLYLDLSDGGGIGFGGYSLGSKAGIKYLEEILKVVGVEQWEKLEGKYVRVKLDSWNGPVSAIGNIIEEEWLNQKDFFKQYED